MSGFAPYGTVVPTVAKFQWSLGGLTVGENQGASGWSVQYSDGLDLPPISSGDQKRPFDIGEFIGDDFPDGRDLTVQLLRYGGTAYQGGAAALTLQQALVNLLPTAQSPYAGETETPIWVNRPGFGQLCASVRWRKYGQRSDVNLAYFKQRNPIIVMHATDPRLYGPTTRTQLSAPSAGTGLSFNFSFPISFGGGSAISQATINNTGTIEMRPLITIQGPSDTPSLSNATLSGTPTIAYNLVLGSNQQLVIDLDLESAYITTIGTGVNVDVDSTLVAGSTFWNLPPGNNLIQYSDNNSKGICYVDWAPAYIAAV